MINLFLLSSIVSLLFLLYFKWLKTQNFWKNKGIAYDQPLPFFGNLMANLLKKKSLGELIAEIGFKYSNEPLVGFFNFYIPTLVINDPSYAEIVLVKEFSSFTNRREDMKHIHRRPLDNHLFFLTGSEWKAVRSKLTPVFSTGKLRGMLENIEMIFEETMKDIETNKSINTYALIEKFSLRVRASCVFGIDLSKSDQEDEFIANAKNTSKPSFKTFVQTVVSLFFQRTAKILNISFFGAENEKYFVETILKSFKERFESKISKQDFVQTMMELKYTGKVTVQNWSNEDEFLKTDDDRTFTDSIELTDDILVSQCIVFLLAGMEPLVTTLTMLMAELGKNKNILAKVKKEIDSIIDEKKCFSYESLNKMQYLELCINEVMRLHTPVDILVRHCNKTHTFPNGVTVEKGTDIIIPILKYHMDPSIFPEPEVFNPDRFDRTPYPICAYSPFGTGPRYCIAKRFGMMEMKMFASKLIYNYDFHLDAKTELPVKIHKWYFLRKLISPVYIKLKGRSRQT